MTRPDDKAERELRRLTRRGFLTGGIAAAVGAIGWGWVESRGESDGVPWPLRRVLETNGKLWRRLGCGRVEGETTTPLRGVPARLNGDVGLRGTVEASGWRIEIDAPGRKTERLALNELARLPRREETVELRCVEGWSQRMSFSGFRFTDFMEERRLPRTGFVGLETPRREYYVSLDMDSMVHPQTLLVDRMNGEPLSSAHGAPLRLFTPVKYGFKCLKRIAAIRFADERPPDYWEERGYDWYAGL